MGEAKARVKRAAIDLPDLVTHRVVAEKFGVPTDTLRDWVAKGEFPEPHSLFERTWLYRLDVIRTFLETGLWPEGTKFKRVRDAHHSG